MVLKKLAEISDQLHEEGKYKEASLFDKAIIRIAQMDDEGSEMDDAPEGELLSLDLPTQRDEIYEFDEEEGAFEVLLAFVQSLHDGAFSDIKEAEEAAAYFLSSYAPKESMDDAEEDLSYPDPGTDDSELGQVINFPTE